MRYRKFGSTGLQISEVAFGSWSIGNGYGSVDRAQALNALARAEELGCNFVDTAGVYGDAERTLGEFLRGRRRKWHIATKYSGQDAGLEQTLNGQLTRLGTDTIDFYQLHWAPRPDSKDGALYEQLYRVKKAGKARFIGASLYTASDIDFVLKETQLDGFQVAFSLLDPNPVLARLDLIRQKGPAILIRSALKEGFLTGKYKANATFPDPNDQRHKWTAKQIADTVSAAERFRFLQAEAGGSLATAALRYPLSFPEVSAVLAGTKNETQASENFGKVPGATLSTAGLERVRAIQGELGLLGADSWFDKLKSMFGVRS
jgi:aryl-alcohol dehydrogenase-like predicted oxidoreductase